MLEDDVLVKVLDRFECSFTPYYNVRSNTCEYIDQILSHLRDIGLKRHFLLDIHLFQVAQLCPCLLVSYD